MVPAPAVQFGSRGTYVYLVNAEQKATVRDVVVGPTDGVNLSIVKGLEAGEIVVLEGLDRLREGRPVLVVTEEAKAPSAPKAGGGGKKKKKEK